jgi:phosphotransferase system  glucose/maltose/N-acetylglucosamine-specific IIC component
LLASAGLIGVGLFFWFAWALIQRLRKAQRTFSGVQHVYLVGAAIGIAGIAVHSLVDFGLHITSNALLFVMLLAFVSLNAIDQRAAAQEHRSAAFK